MNITQPTTRIPATQCSCCGAPLSSGFGYDIPLIGIVGPVCKNKFGELIVLLERIKTENFPMGGELEQRSAAQLLVNKLHRLGFREAHQVDNGDGTKRIELGHRSRTKQALVKSWKQRRKEFIRDLQIAEGKNGVVGTDWAVAL